MYSKMYCSNALQIVWLLLFIAVQRLTSQIKSVALCVQTGSVVLTSQCCFNLELSPLTRNDLLFIPRVITGESCLQRYTRLSFQKASEWHWKQSLCNRGSLCLAVTYQVTQSFWLCKQKSREVSWHCTFKSRKKKKKTAPQHKKKSPYTTHPALVCASWCHTLRH